MPCRGSLNFECSYLYRVEIIHFINRNTETEMQIYTLLVHNQD